MYVCKSICMICMCTCMYDVCLYVVLRTTYYYYSTCMYYYLYHSTCASTYVCMMSMCSTYIHVVHMRYCHIQFCNTRVYTPLHLYLRCTHVPPKPGNHNNFAFRPNNDTDWIGFRLFPRQRLRKGICFFWTFERMVVPVNVL